MMISMIGSRWLAHKTAAMRIINVKNISTDKPHPSLSKDREQFLGYLREWNTISMLENIEFYLRILEPAKVLPRRHTTSFQRLYDVDVCEVVWTSYRRWNDVVFLLTWTLQDREIDKWLDH